jgi:hypothetical protein
MVGREEVCAFSTVVDTERPLPECLRVLLPEEALAVWSAAADSSAVAEPPSRGSDFKATSLDCSLAAAALTLFGE